MGTTIGTGAAKTGSATGVIFIGGAGRAGASGRRTPPCTGVEVLKSGLAVSMSLKIPVKLGPESGFPAAPVIAGAAVAWPKTAVNSPTVFFGGSIGWDVKRGMSDGLSGRNGPWKKLVNSPGLERSFATGSGSSGASGLAKLGDTGGVTSFGGAATLAFTGSHGTAA